MYFDEKDMGKWEVFTLNVEYSLIAQSGDVKI
jgi:hypothetical protein